MPMTAACAAILTAAIIALAGRPAGLDADDRAEADALLGTWTVAESALKIEIYSCAGKYCGRIAWMAEPTQPDGAPRLDRRNPNPKKRGAQILGLEVLWGLSYTDGKWTGGQLYNIQEGKTYNCYMELIEAGKLRVQSFVGIAALGKTHIWTR